MDTLAAIVRQRTVMTAIADVIVAAAAGKSLRVAIACTNTDVIAFADHLTQALHARGRPCRCLPPKPMITATSSVHSQDNSPLVAVIVGGVPSPDETDLCHIDIQLHARAQLAGAGSSPHGRLPDIVVDYLDPNGPTIRHIAATLMALPGRH